MKGILLDTCAILWLADGRPAGPATRRLIDEETEGGEVFLSPITAWEIGMLSSKEKIILSKPPMKWLNELKSKTGIKWCDMPPSLLVQSSLLPGQIHGDPADRIIAASAREFELTLITGDKNLLAYGKKGYLQAHPYD